MNKFLFSFSAFLLQSDPFYVLQHFLLHVFVILERSEGNEVMKIAVHDKCFGARKDFGGVEMVQGAQPRRSTVEPACMVHGCKVNPLVWSIFGWSRPKWTFY